MQLMCLAGFIGAWAEDVNFSMSAHASVDGPENGNTHVTESATGGVTIAVPELPVNLHWRAELITQD